MVDYLNNGYNQNNKLEEMNNNFWKLYSNLNEKYLQNQNLHGIYRSKFSGSYLKNNKQWIN